MRSSIPTLLDPFEIGAPRARLPSIDQITEWFDRAELALLDVAWGFVGEVEEYSEAPPWTPEPVDRRWRARGWTDDD
jgi:hypothetical protein